VDVQSQTLAAAVSKWLSPDRPVFLAYAPGRLDVLGGIADYSGATVLEMPLALTVKVVLQAVADGLLAVQTGGSEMPHLKSSHVTVPVDVLFDGAPEGAPARLRNALSEQDALWAAYLLGPLAVLVANGLVTSCSGLRMVVWSDVVSGAGISSSAALEVASLRAMDALFDTKLEGLRLALLAQQAEHTVAGAPCGVMDQTTAMLGRRDQLLMLRCQPAEVLGYRALPKNVQVLGIGSGVAHRVAGTQYGRVRTATFMGRAMIAAGDPSQPPDGYLCNLSVSDFEARFERQLPNEMRGREFMSMYGGTGDDATAVDPAASYSVRDCTAHPIHEQANVNAFLAALDAYEASGDLNALRDAGTAMLRSHESYSRRCGLGTPETDLIVDMLLRQSVTDGAIFGAKITGGGAGGTVAVLGAGRGLRKAIEAVTARYIAATGNPARIIAGSGDGAAYLPIERNLAQIMGLDDAQ
jgi:galactokinase